MKTNSHCGKKSQSKGKVIFEIFTNKLIAKISKQSGYKKRNKGKINARSLIIGFMIMISKKLNTYEAWASEISVLIGKSVTRQGIENRMKSETATMLKMILEEKLKESINPNNLKRRKGVVSKFRTIMLEDSTVFKLPKELSKVFSGNVSRGEKKSQVKIHALYNFTENTFKFLQLCNFTDNDQSLASVVLPYLRKGDLIIRDMGFLVLDALKQLIAKGVYYISRKNSQIKVYALDTGKEINLKQELRKQHYLDIYVLVGKVKKIKMRLIVLPVSPEKADERRRKARKDRDKRLNHSQEYYKLLGYSIFITNIPNDLCKPEEILELYGLRWRIEIIFKSWKSCFSLERLIPSRCKNPQRIYSLIYLMLLYILIFQVLWFNAYKTKLEKHMFLKLSLIKMAKFFIQHFLLLATLENQNNLRKQIKLQCHYDRRNDRLNTIQKYEKMAA